MRILCVWSMEFDRVIATVFSSFSLVFVLVIFLSPVVMYVPSLFRVGSLVTWPSQSHQSVVEVSMMGPFMRESLGEDV